MANSLVHIMLQVRSLGVKKSFSSIGARQSPSKLRALWLVLVISLSPELRIVHHFFFVGFLIPRGIFCQNLRIFLNQIDRLVFRHSWHHRPIWIHLAQQVHSQVPQHIFFQSLGHFLGLISTQVTQITQIFVWASFPKINFLIDGFFRLGEYLA